MIRDRTASAASIRSSMRRFVLVGGSCWLGFAFLSIASASAAGAAVEAAVEAEAVESPPAIPPALPGAPDLPDALRARLATALAAAGPDAIPRTKHKRADGAPIYSNRLLLESSPYLQQHAHNPVNWFPWGDEAFATAKRLGRPVLVSIGYSTCHWCHVMEEESFDDVETATFLNQHFVAIKIDREVRPDLDAIYMTAAQALTGSGGWPLNVFTNADREPFFAGTYFPPRDGRGQPGFMTVLRSISEAYASRPEEIGEMSRQLTEVIRLELEGSVAQSTEVPSVDVFDRVVAQLKSAYDANHGGVKGRPKFPSGLPMRFLLRYHRRTGDEQSLSMVSTTLRKMARGGIHDQIGGGFHRYATDESWRVPHFEKMLYDNALLAITYLEAWQATGDDEFAKVARGILDYIAREMTAPEGGFHSATDADSPTPRGGSEEGYFFTWTEPEIDAALDPALARAVKTYHATSPSGNFEGRNILTAPDSLATVAAKLQISPELLASQLEEAHSILYQVRSRRRGPHLDEKILVSWNGLTISALARAGLAFAEPEYTKRAARAADFLLTKMRKDGRLRRHHSRGRASGDAFLDDYAFLIAGLLDLAEADPDPRWLREARALQTVLDAHYADVEGGGYFMTANDHERLLVREKPAYDGAEPSGNSVAILDLLRIGELTTEPRDYERAVHALSAFHETFEDDPRSLGEMLLALDFLHDSPKEIVLVHSEGGRADAMLAPLRSSFVPNRVLIVTAEGDALADSIPLVRGKRTLDGRTTAYVCVRGVCAYPTTDPAEFTRQIERVQGRPTSTKGEETP